MCLPDLREAERQAPRTGRGDKPDIPDWLLAGLIMVAVLHKKKSKSAQYRFLGERRADWGGVVRGYPVPVAGDVLPPIPPTLARSLRLVEFQPHVVVHHPTHHAATRDCQLEHVRALFHQSGVERD